MGRYVVELCIQGGWQVIAPEGKRAVASFGHETRALNAADAVCSELNGLVAQLEKAQEAAALERSVPG
jgi:hypothetical protein